MGDPAPVNFIGGSLDGDGFDEQREWPRTSWQALKPYHVEGDVDLPGDEGPKQIRDVYGEQKSSDSVP